MNYEETLSYLYHSTPLFQHVGKAGYKEGLHNSHLLDEHFDHPHASYKTIHIAGTNGKGSCAHTLAAILQASGYRVGLYTSPHLADFRERIRVNGVPIPEERVIKFVADERNFFEPLHPSFFELTTTMAFFYFKEAKVDIAVIEVGLGGRLECTNIISPILSIITNISFDHTEFLGKSLPEIAREKAGIIKRTTPIIIGETHTETKPVFIEKAKEECAPILFAEEAPSIMSSQPNVEQGGIDYTTKAGLHIHGELGGLYQEKNTNTILTAIEALRLQNLPISDNAICEGFSHVCDLTGLMGRWQKVCDKPTVVCDTGHNEGGFAYLSKQLRAQKCKQLRIVIGMVNDKDIRGVMSQLPINARYYFTKANIPRALHENEVNHVATTFGLKGEAYATVGEAYTAAINDSDPKDFIFVGGSSYIVADFIVLLRKA